VCFRVRGAFAYAFSRSTIVRNRTYANCARLRYAIAKCAENIRHTSKFNICVARFYPSDMFGAWFNLFRFRENSSHANACLSWRFLFFSSRLVKLIPVFIYHVLMWAFHMYAWIEHALRSSRTNQVKPTTKTHTHSVWKSFRVCLVFALVNI